jgi:hypothetical protein
MGGFATGESTWMLSRMVPIFLEQVQMRGTWRISGRSVLFRRPMLRFVLGM